jgi:hypothetical protein
MTTPGKSTDPSGKRGSVVGMGLSLELVEPRARHGCAHDVNPLRM